MTPARELRDRVAEALPQVLSGTDVRLRLTRDAEGVRAFWLAKSDALIAIVEKDAPHE